MQDPTCEEVRKQFRQIAEAKATFDSVFRQIGVGAHGDAPSVPTEQTGAEGRAHTHAPPQSAKTARETLRTTLASFRNLLPQKEFRSLHASEHRALLAFFGFPIDIPPLPPEITVERMKRWETMQLELHYLPAFDMAEEKLENLPNWKKPNYQNLNVSKIESGYTNLRGGLVLLDARPKPQRNSGDQMYDKDRNENQGADPLASVIAKLRVDGVIESYKHSTSRFNFSSEELEKLEVRTAFAKVLDIKLEQLSQLRMIEFNVLGNIHHREWGDTNAWEWLLDRYDGQHRLYGGDFDVGGLSAIAHGGRDRRSEGVGFRLLGRF